MSLGSLSLTASLRRGSIWRPHFRCGLMTRRGRAEHRGRLARRRWNTTSFTSAESEQQIRSQLAGHECEGKCSGKFVRLRTSLNYISKWVCLLAIYIIHVCRKRATDPEPVSWARMRREVLREVRQIADILELHLKVGLPAGDLQVIKRGNALEYFSRHYGRVYVDEVKGFSVRDALIGINQLLDEESGAGKEPPPVNAEPFTRQFLRLVDAVTQQPRDQMQKLLRGTTIDPKEYEERGWCKETQKVYHLTSPLEITQEWCGKHRRRLTSDYDQAMVLIGASFPASGVNVMEMLSNTNFRPHPALGGC